MTGHHAYVYYTTSLAALPTELQQPSVDVVHLRSPQWGIAQSRELAAAASTRPVERDVRALVVQTERLTNEAQNALLKLLEDPPATTCVHVLVPGPDRLLETVRSRLQVATTETQTAADADWQTLRAQPLATQLSEITARTKAKDTGWQHAVLTAAVADTTVPALVRQQIDQYAAQAGASRKMLLEELVLSLAR